MINQPGICEDRPAPIGVGHLLDRVAGQQVHRHAEDRGHLVLHREEAKAGVDGKGRKQIDVAAAPGLAPRGRAEGLQTRDAGLAAILGQKFCHGLRCWRRPRSTRGRRLAGAHRVPVRQCLRAVGGGLRWRPCLSALSTEGRVIQSGQAKRLAYRCRGQCVGRQRPRGWPQLPLRAALQLGCERLPLLVAQKLHALEPLQSGRWIPGIKL